MRRIKVRSASLHSVGYDDRTRTLEVEFNNQGRIYQYLGVPAERHLSLIKADSIGAYLNRYIKPSYRCRRVVTRPRQPHQRGK